MKKQKLYLSCMLMLLVALVAASMFPQLVLGIQDTYRMRNIQTKSREEMDMINIDIPYEMSVGKRLGNFAKNNVGFLTAGSECTVNEESYELADRILFGEGMLFLSYGILPLDHVQYGYRIENLKKYVIYDEEPDSSIALLAWYFKLNFDDGRYLEFLVDDKTDTIYYVKYSGAAVNSLFFKKIYAEDMIFYFRNYYACDTSKNEMENRESMNYDVRYALAEEIVFEQNRLEATLFYGDASLDFIFEIEENEKNTSSDISIGIRQIGELILELQ